jgi:tetratricopeptide (TPR) repeat protein
VEPPRPLGPGDNFDRYEIQAVIGEGGMGRVYRAFDPRLQRVVALKVLRRGAGDTNGAQRMVREARAAAALNHPNAVAVFDAGEHEGTAFIAMELVPGRSLRRCIEDAESAPIPLDLRIQWLGDVARALAAAHRRGIVHRDVKPENVVVREDGVVKVLDFGIARRVHAPGAPGAGAYGDTITQDGTLVGTPLYMAPEQLLGETIDQRVDQFAWGVLAYELLTGGRPWGGSDVRAIAAILQHPAPPLGDRAGGAPPRVETTILRALAKRPADRFASMDDLRVSFEGDGAAPSSNAPPSAKSSQSAPEVASLRTGVSTRNAPTRRGALVLVSGAVLLIGVVALAVSGRLAARPPVPSPLQATSASAAASAAETARPIDVRRSLAVFGLRDPGAHQDAGAWRSTAIGELLAAQLGAGERLRIVPSERVARGRIELAITDDAPLTPDAIARLGRNLDADLAVTGAILGPDGGGQSARRSIALQVTVLEARTGHTIASVTEEGTEGELFAVVARIATTLRTALGVGELTPEQHVVLGSSIPEDDKAARLYAEAIDEQHHFHDMRAIALFAEATRIAPQFALGHAHAAESLARLGHDDEATAEAKRAFDLSNGLPREERLWIEATYRAAAHEWEEAARTYEALFTFFPDNVEYAVGMLQMSSYGGHPKDTLASVARVRRMPPVIAEDPRIDYEEGRAAHMTNDYDRCLRVARDCRRRAKERGNLIIFAKAGFEEGVAQINLGHPDEGLRVLGEGRDLAASLGDTYTAHVLEGPIASEYEKRGDLVQARTVLEGSEAGLRALGNLYWATSASEQIGWLDVMQGQVAEGRRKVEAAIAYYRHARQSHALEGGLPPLGELVATEGDPVRGAAIVNEAIPLTQRAGRKNAEAGAELSLAMIARVTGDVAAETQHEEKALALWQETKSVSGEAHARHEIGVREWAAGELVGARRDLELALHAREGLGRRFDVAESKLALARLAITEGRAAEAETMAQEALGVFETAKAEPFVGEALAVLAWARAAEGDRAGAEQFATKASERTTADVGSTVRRRRDISRARGLFE